MYRILCDPHPILTLSFALLYILECPLKTTLQQSNLTKNLKIRNLSNLSHHQKQNDHLLELKDHLYLHLVQEFILFVQLEKKSFF